VGTNWGPTFPLMATAADAAWLTFRKHCNSVFPMWNVSNWMGQQMGESLCVFF